ncbi:MAG TPA: energy transducer TonB [Ignavibacteria bacterium]|nr:energy transducer TonB [Ignavibacteria bacterium]
MDNIKLLNVPYGASELKAVAPKYTFRGFISALVIYALVAGGIILKGYIDSTAEIPEVKDNGPVVIYLDDMLPPSLTEPEKPEEVKPQQNVPLKDDEAMTPEPVKRDDAEIQTIKTQQELNTVPDNVSKDGEEGVANNNTGTVVERPETPEVPEEVIKPPVVEDLSGNFTVDKVQKSPNALNLAQIQGRMEYPEIAVEQGIEGRVTVKVLVDRNGNVIRVGSMTGNSIFYDEVEEKIRDLNFEPAIKNGQPVNCWVMVPFTFKLSNKFK